MFKANLLEELKSLDLNLARLKCLVILLAALLRHRTVNLTILATENTTGAKNESCYRRFQHFFLEAALCLDSVGRFMLRKIPRPADGWILSMDRTNWKHGKRHINILTVGVVVNKVAIPIAWMVLPQATKRGNSSTTHRIKLFKRVLRIIDAGDIRVLAMDREFGGKKWLGWLEKQGVGYVARIRGNTLVDGKKAALRGSTRRAAAGKPSRVFGMNLFFASKTIQAKGRRDERLQVVSNRFGGKEMLEMYQLRWGIESLFSHLKKRGFDLEATHMTDGRKLEKLFALVSLGFLLAFGWGCHLRNTRKTTKAMARKSLFRRGLEDILRLLANPFLGKDEWTSFLHWLRSPAHPSIFVV